MRHEYPNSAASNVAIRGADPPALINRNNKEKITPAMAVIEKENNHIPFGSTNSKAPIPEHIYDVNAKTFYKLGQFLGKVNILFILLINIFQGGFATCYQVTSEATEKQYAVKIVPKASLIKPKQKNKVFSI